MCWFEIGKRPTQTDVFTPHFHEGTSVEKQEAKMISVAPRRLCLRRGESHIGNFVESSAD